MRVRPIVITDDATTPARYSSDTWEVDLLCADCERLLNERYDSYGIAVFRGHEGKVRRQSSGVHLLRIDQRRLRMFFLSVLWRISVSSHPNYSNIDLPSEWEDDLRAALYEGRPIPDGRYTVAVYKLRDSTDPGGFSNEDLRNFIVSPFARGYGQFVSVCFPFLGFFVETFLPKVPERFAKRSGVLRGRSPVFVAPYNEVLDIPEIMSILVRALAKDHKEPSRIV